VEIEKCSIENLRIMRIESLIITYGMINKIKSFQFTFFFSGTPSHARLGLHRLTDEKAGVTIEIDEMIRHPDYKPPALYADIALVKLRYAIYKFTVSIRPACLHQQYDIMPTNASISGWGVTEFGKYNSIILHIKSSNH